MKAAAVSELKAHLSEYLNQVKSGAEVLVTDRGKPVARIVPVAEKSRQRGTLSRMEKNGLIKLGSGKLPKGFWEMSRPEDQQGTVRKALIEERESGR